MKSGKQRRAEISAKRKKRAADRQPQGKFREPASYRIIPVNEALLAPNNSYGVPDFVRRGYYIDLPFRCVDCGAGNDHPATCGTGGVPGQAE